MIYAACILGGAVIVVAAYVALADYCTKCIAEILNHSPEGD